MKKPSAVPPGPPSGKPPPSAFNPKFAEAAKKKSMEGLKNKTKLRRKTSVPKNMSKIPPPQNIKKGTIKRLSALKNRRMSAMSRKSPSMRNVPPPPSGGAVSTNSSDFNLLVIALLLIIADALLSYPVLVVFSSVSFFSSLLNVGI
jgi:hypothetical protein